MRCTPDPLTLVITHCFLSRGTFLVLLAFSDSSLADIGSISMCLMISSVVMHFQQLHFLKRCPVEHLSRACTDVLNTGCGLCFKPADIIGNTINSFFSLVKLESSIKCKQLVAFCLLSSTEMRLDSYVYHSEWKGDSQDGLIHCSFLKSWWLTDWLTDHTLTH